MKIIEVRTQEEFDAALKMPFGDTCIDLIEGEYTITTKGDEAQFLRLGGAVKLRVVARDSSQPRVEARGSSQPRIVARGSSQPHVEAFDSSEPRVEAWGSSKPHVVAWGSSQPHVVARSSSQPRVEARDSSRPRVEAWGSSQPSIVAIGSSKPRVEAWGSSKPHVVAWGSSQPHVVARSSSQPRVEARDSSRPRVEAWGSSQPHVEAFDSSEPRVEAWGSSQPSIVAIGSSKPRVEARGSSQPRVEAWGSSQPRVEAFSFSQLSISGHVVAKCAPTVSVLIEGDRAKVEGGKQTMRVAPKDGQSWCEYYGVPVKNGKAILFKVVDKNLRSFRGLVYKIGSRVKSCEWDEEECSHGLHFVPRVFMANEFAQALDSLRYIACEVLVKDLLVFPFGSYPNKAKAPSCKVLYEVDEDGRKL